MFSESELTGALYLENIKDLMSNIKRGIGGIPRRIKNTGSDFKQKHPLTYGGLKCQLVPIPILAAGAVYDYFVNGSVNSAELVNCFAVTELLQSVGTFIGYVIDTEILQKIDSYFTTNP